MFDDDEQSRKSRQEYLDTVSEQRRAEQMRSEGNGGGCIEAILLIWIAPALLIHWLNFALPFWLRCIVAIAAGALTANYVGRKWSAALPFKLITFTLVAGVLFAGFRDEQGAGQTLFGLWSQLLGIGLWLLIGLAIIGLIGGWFKGYFLALGQNPLGVGCGTLVVFWLIWLLAIKGPEHSAATSPKQTISHKQKRP